MLLLPEIHGTERRGQISQLLPICCSPNSQQHLTFIKTSEKLIRSLEKRVSKGHVPVIWLRLGIFIRTSRLINSKGTDRSF